MQTEKSMTKEEEINANIQVGGVDTNKISDGYHTFEELYEHRIVLYIALCRALVNDHTVWRSRKHSDGSSWEGWFVLGIGVSNGTQITYHLPDRFWDDCSFAGALEIAPWFDGHTSADVLQRIKSL